MSFLYKIKKRVILYGDFIILKVLLNKLFFFKKDIEGITIIITSSGRIDYLKETLQSLKENFHTDLPLYWYIIDDFPKSKLTQQFISSLGFDVTLLNKKNKGLGYSLNRIYNKVKTKYIFHCEDDWRFMKKIPLIRMVEILEQDKTIGQVILRRREQYKSTISKRMDDYAVYEKTFSFNPHLTSRSINKKCLPYPLSQAERKITDRLRKLNIKSVILGNKGEEYVTHIGEDKHAFIY